MPCLTTTIDDILYVRMLLVLEAIYIKMIVDLIFEKNVGLEAVRDATADNLPLS